MFGSDLLDVVIGVVFIFLALSLVASAGAEIIERQLKRRATDLEKGISELVGDPGNTAGFVSRIYNHPLVNSLFQGQHDDRDKSKLPSYIPSRNFAFALLDLARQAKKPAPGETPFALPPNLNAALRILAATAGDDLDNLPRAVQAWYDSSMDRVSGWYKRRTQLFTFLIGLGVAILVNADTVYVTQRLSTDKALRSGLVAAAQAAASRPPDGDKTSADQVIQHQLDRLSGLGIPVGIYAGWPANVWDTSRFKQNDKITAWAQEWAQFVFAHWPGWLITGVAVSFGAPFWFDLLNKLTVIRSTVKPHEKSPEEESRD